MSYINKKQEFIMKKLILFLFSGTLILLIANACSILPSPQKTKITYYDIGAPEKIYNIPSGIQFPPIMGGVGDEPKMVFKTSSNIIKFDPFNRWADSPAKLVRCYMILALNNKTQTINYVMNGEILRFDCDLKKKTVNLAIKITIKSYKAKKADKRFISQIIYESSIPIKEKTGTAYAEAMEQAIAEITKKAAHSLTTVKKK